MSRKLNSIPDGINSYDDIRHMMEDDLQYRLEDRKTETSLGRPLYLRINIQIVMTHACPYKCPWCLERKNPMGHNNDNHKKQLDSLKAILKEHPNARLTITGGEPSLYIERVKEIVSTYKENGNDFFVVVNTTGYNKEILNVEGTRVNLSVNEFLTDQNLDDFHNVTYQTVMEDMSLDNIMKFMDETPNTNEYSFRYLTELDKADYDISILNDMKSHPEFEVRQFRVGDFFMYVTFTYKGNKGRVTLGDMNKQISNDYQDGYSNIIIETDGTVNTNWGKGSKK